MLQNYIIATEQAVSGRPAHLWIYDRKSDDFSGYKLALDRQPNDIVMYDARRQLSLDCESFLNYLLTVSMLFLSVYVVVVSNYSNLHQRRIRFTKSNRNTCYNRKK